MVFEIDITATAEEEAEESYHWIARYSLPAADKWYAGLLEKIGSLRSNPSACALAPESSPERELRQVLYGKRQNIHRILFTISGSTVRVLHIRHGARRLLDE